MIRRICFYGGANTGKSVEAAKAFVSLKLQHKRVDLVTEFIKEWVYEDRMPVSFDQVYIFTKQLHKEDLRLRAGMDFITTDCPVFLGCCYAKRHQTPGWKQLAELSDIFDEHYAPLNIYLERAGKPYDPVGRYQNEEGAKVMDTFILDELKRTGKEFHVVHSLDEAALLSLLSAELNK